MSRVHLLASCAVTLGQLCGYSPEFSEMGELFMPVTQQGAPQTSEWQAYMEACSLGRPLPVRDELWIAAHMNDMRRVQSAGLDRLFYETAAEHSRDPMWNMVRKHMEVTLGSRLMDHAALSGEVPFETAIAHSFALGLKRLFSQGWDLLRYFAKETTRAILVPAETRPGKLPPFSLCVADKHGALLDGVSNVPARDQSEGARQRMFRHALAAAGESSGAQNQPGPSFDCRLLQQSRSL